MPSMISEQLIQINDESSSLEPWVADAQLRSRLQDAVWRYAALIGVVDPEEVAIPRNTRDKDRDQYGHLIQKCEGSPLWDDNDATMFVAEVSGASRETSAAWIELNWHKSGEASVALPL